MPMHYKKEKWHVHECKGTWGVTEPDSTQPCVCCNKCKSGDQQKTDASEGSPKQVHDWLGFRAFPKYTRVSDTVLPKMWDFSTSLKAGKTKALGSEEPDILLHHPLASVIVTKWRTLWASETGTMHLLLENKRLWTYLQLCPDAQNDMSSGSGESQRNSGRFSLAQETLLCLLCLLKLLQKATGPKAGKCRTDQKNWRETTGILKLIFIKLLLCSQHG